jgi:hypothetical protein
MTSAVAARHYFVFALRARRRDYAVLYSVCSAAVLRGVTVFSVPWITGCALSLVAIGYGQRGDA